VESDQKYKQTPQAERERLFEEIFRNYRSNIERDPEFEGMSRFYAKAKAHSIFGFSFELMADLDTYIDRRMSEERAKKQTAGTRQQATKGATQTEFDSLCARLYNGEITEEEAEKLGGASLRQQYDAWKASHAEGAPDTREAIYKEYKSGGLTFEEALRRGGGSHMGDYIIDREREEFDRKSALQEAELKEKIDRLHEERDGRISEVMEDLERQMGELGRNRAREERELERKLANLERTLERYAAQDY